MTTFEGMYGVVPIDILMFEIHYDEIRRCSHSMNITGMNSIELNTYFCDEYNL